MLCKGEGHDLRVFSTRVGATTVEWHTLVLRTFFMLTFSVFETP
jgi:hypothetical protein